jgi:hypothetical protein
MLKEHKTDCCDTYGGKTKLGNKGEKASAGNMTQVEEHGICMTALPSYGSSCQLALPGSAQLGIQVGRAISEAYLISRC